LMKKKEQKSPGMRRKERTWDNNKKKKKPLHMFRLHIPHPWGFSAGTHLFTDNLPFPSNHPGFVTTSENTSSQPYAFRITSINTEFASDRMISSAPADFAKRIAWIMSALCNNKNPNRQHSVSKEWAKRQVQQFKSKSNNFLLFPSSSRDFKDNLSAVQLPPPSIDLKKPLNLGDIWPAQSS